MCCAVAEAEMQHSTQVASFKSLSDEANRQHDVQLMKLQIDVCTLVCISFIGAAPVGSRGGGLELQFIQKFSKFFPIMVC